LLLPYNFPSLNEIVDNSLQLVTHPQIGVPTCYQVPHGGGENLIGHQYPPYKRKFTIAPTNHFEFEGHEFVQIGLHWKVEAYLNHKVLNSFAVWNPSQT
jgi:hypothetical protein